MLTPIYDNLTMENMKYIRRDKYGEYVYKNINMNNIDIYMCEEIIPYTPVNFDKLKDLFDKGLSSINAVYDSIINPSNIKKEKIEFVDWLNSLNGTIIRKTEQDCETNCDIKINLPIRLKIRTGLKVLRDKIIEQIIYNDTSITSILQFIKYNIKILSLLLQVNSISENMDRLNNILNKCTVLSCHDIYEINEIFSNRDDNIDIFEMIIELVFGKVLRQEQINRYRDMVKDYHKGQRSVYQFMMGKGKSSIITPMLYYNLTHYGEKVYIVVPPHLEKQTIATYYSFNMFLNNMPEIITDNKLKLY
ncbi:MAG: DUF3638 domain-containing protein, partial [Alphaproteobacteria bacterium]|nr:DUF3638 domain-containing protein [Alphaproteobacteria bacterium]